MDLEWAFTLHQTIGIAIGLVVVFVITRVINTVRQTDED